MPDASCYTGIRIVERLPGYGLNLDISHKRQPARAPTVLFLSAKSKDGAHERRTCGRAGPTMDFTRDMVMKSKNMTSYPTKTTSSDSLGC